MPLGAFLSGGIDSTIVVGVMSQLTSAPVKTFSIGFEGDAAYDETAYARMAAERFKTEHTEFRVAPSALDLIDTLIWHHDGPFGDSSAVPTYIVSKLAREHVTVVLTGDGGDEVFAGYRRFAAALMSERLPSPAIHAARVLSSALPASRHDRTWWASARRFRARPPPIRWTCASPGGWRLSSTISTPLLRPEFRAVLGPVDKLAYLAAEQDRMRGLSTLSRLLHANFVSYLPDDLLVKADRCTMANSLEARSPFLDRELIEFAARLPDDIEAARPAHESDPARSVRRSAAAGHQSPRQDGVWRASRRVVPWSASRLRARPAVGAERALPRHVVRTVRRDPGSRSPVR